MYVVLLPGLPVNREQQTDFIARTRGASFPRVAVKRGFRLPKSWTECLGRDIPEIRSFLLLKFRVQVPVIGSGISGPVEMDATSRAKSVSDDTKESANVKRRREG